MRFGIVGGGLLGMTLAWDLSKAGHDVTILEGAPCCGGLAGPWQLGDVVWGPALPRDAAKRSRVARALARARSRAGSAMGQDRDGLFRRWNDAPVLGSRRLRTISAFVSMARRNDLQGIANQRLASARAIDGSRVAHAALRAYDRRAHLATAAARETRPHATRASAAFIWAIIARMFAARGSGPNAKCSVTSEMDTTDAAPIEERLAARNVEIWTSYSIERIQLPGRRRRDFCRRNDSFRSCRRYVGGAWPHGCVRV